MLTKLSDFYTTLGLVRVWQHFTFTVAELWDFVRTNMYFFHMSEEKSSKFLDFYCLQNFRSDTCTVPLMSFQSNGVPFDQFSWNFMQMIKVCTKRSFDFNDVHVCRLKVIHLYSINVMNALMAQLFIFASTALKGDIQIIQFIMVILGCE